jgi:hypothetical protein
MSSVPADVPKTPPEVDLAVNCWERSVERVLAPGFFAAIEDQNRRRFTRRVAIINNVRDPDAARERAERLRQNGEIDAFLVVSDEVESALERVGLRRADLGRIPHYSDCALVAICDAGSEWMLYWDAEAWLESPSNWVDPAINLMQGDRRILVANPNWDRPNSDARREALEESAGFAIGYGFSDAVFLARRADLQSVSYKCSCPASLRYPLAHVAALFEQRVDAYMRTKRRLRATCFTVTYRHPPEGVTYPKVTRLERLRRRRNRWLLKLTSKLPTSDPRFVVCPTPPRRKPSGARPRTPIGRGS